VLAAAEGGIVVGAFGLVGPQLPAFPQEVYLPPFLSSFPPSLAPLLSPPQLTPAV
jgi:hypothetical protein